MIFKRLEKQLDELMESLSKNSTVVDNLAQYKLKKAYIIMGCALDTSRLAVMEGMAWHSAAYLVAEEMFKQLRTARKLIGEVIGEGGVDDE